MIPKIITSHILSNEKLEYNKKQIVNFFHPYGITTDNYSLSLISFIQNSPQRYFCPKSMDLAYEFFEKTLNTNPSILFDTFKEFSEEISHGLRLLKEINDLNFHESSPDTEVETIYFIDNELNPALLKLIEGPFGNLILPISALLRKNRNKQLDNLDLYNRVQELKNSTELNPLIIEYSNTIRNSIAHGKVSFQLEKILYKDKKETIVITYKEAIKKFDRMLDICNGMALGYQIVFAKKNSFFGEKSIPIPTSITENDLNECLSIPNWNILKIINSEILGNRSQLHIFVKNSFKSSDYVNFHSFRTAVLAEKHLPKYDRYFISLKSRKNELGWDIFDGANLERCRLSKNEDFLQYKDSRGDNFLFYIQPKSPIVLLKLFDRISTFKEILITKIRFSFKKHSYFKTRKVSTHKNRFHQVIIGSSVIYPKNNMDEKKIVLKFLEKIAKDVKKMSQYDKFYLKYLPIGYLKINVYNKDFRKKELGVSGLIPQLVCTIIKRKLKRIREIDIFEGTPQIIKGYRIVWNKSFLETLRKEPGN
jgi:hypothetical protein